MPVTTTQVKGSESTLRIGVDDLSRGWSTRTFPHLLPDGFLAVADNCAYFRDGLVSKRPGNGFYGGSASGRIGSGTASLAATRFYFGTPRAGQLVVQSAGALYKGNDVTGAFTAISGATGFSTTQPATFTQMRDINMSTGNAVALIICDGSRVPYLYDGTNVAPFSTAAGFLPNGLRTGTPIKPKYCYNWGQHLVLGGDPDDPTGLWISQAQLPEQFTQPFQDNAGNGYYAYYPGGQDGILGNIAGFTSVGPFLVIFFDAGVVSGVNTGAYGNFQFQFQRVSSSVGCTSPRSIVAFDSYAFWFGGDRFYATNGLQIEPLADEIPTVYSSTSRSAAPPLIKNIATLAATRRGSQYWASYDSSGAGTKDQIVVFDISSAGGYEFGSATTVTTGDKTPTSGGAWARWLGMSMNWGVECRGPADTAQLFWGRSDTDIVATHDVGTYDDFGGNIVFSVSGKAYFFDQPINPKTVQALYPMLVYDIRAAAYDSSVSTFIQLDQLVITSPVVITHVAQSGKTYGNYLYGSFVYGALQNILQASPKTYPGAYPKGGSIQPGMTESSPNPINLIGFVFEVTFDDPEDAF